MNERPDIRVSSDRASRQALDRPRLCASCAAFTLIEVVVALALSALLLTAVQALLVGVQRSSRTIEMRTGTAARHSLPTKLLTQDLSSRPAGFDLRLEERTLTFGSLNAMQTQRAAVREAVNVQYRTEPAADGALTLTRYEKAVGIAEFPEAGVVVAGALEHVQFEVYASGGWQDRWPPQTPKKPLALRALLRWLDGTEQQVVIALASPRWKHHGASP